MGRGEGVDGGVRDGGGPGEGEVDGAERAVVLGGAAGVWVLHVGAG